MHSNTILDTHSSPSAVLKMLLPTCTLPFRTNYFHWQHFRQWFCFLCVPSASIPFTFRQPRLTFAPSDPSTVTLSTAYTVAFLHRTARVYDTSVGIINRCVTHLDCMLWPNSPAGCRCRREMATLMRWSPEPVSHRYNAALNLIGPNRQETRDKIVTD